MLSVPPLTVKRNQDLIQLESLLDLVRFTVVTDDFKKSIEFYQDVLGLKMRPPCSGVAMFDLHPSGGILFECCLRSFAMDLVTAEFQPGSVSGTAITLQCENQEKLDFLLNRLRSRGLEVSEASSSTYRFTDFNGVIWILAV